MLNQTLQRDQTIVPAPLTISELKMGSPVRGWLLVTGLQTAPGCDRHAVPVPETA